MNQSKTLAIGLDGCRSGWVAARLHGPKSNAAEWQTELLPLAEIGQVFEMCDAGPEIVIAIDIPIGLPDAVEYRPCDVQGRAALPGLKGSVFCPPPRPIIDASDFADVQAWVAKAKVQDPTAKGLSRQSAALIPKVREVDEWLRSDLSRNDWVVECHPELAFRRLNGDQPLRSKRSPAGSVSRLALVSAAFTDARERLADFAPSGADFSDALDAYGALSVAMRVKEGVSQELGDGEPDGCGLPMRIVI